MSADCFIGGLVVGGIGKFVMRVPAGVLGKDFDGETASPDVLLLIGNAPGFMATKPFIDCPSFGMTDIVEVIGKGSDGN